MFWFGVVVGFSVGFVFWLLVAIFIGAAINSMEEKPEEKVVHDMDIKPPVDDSDWKFYS